MTSSGPGAVVGGVRLTAGVRESEAALIATLRALQAGGGADVARLVRSPVRLVVSSRPLREQLSAQLVAQLGPALLGVVVQTLPMLAETLLRRAGSALRSDHGLFPALVQREVARDLELASTLGALERGHALAAATVSDLLSAGLTRQLAQRLPGLLAGAADEDARRVLALAGAATRVEAELEGHGLARRETAIARAVEALRSAGPRLLDARAVLILGFADATGQRAALLRALLANGATLFTELPRDRLLAGRRSAGCVFAERFVARLGLPRAAIIDTPTALPPASLSFVAASGIEAEVTEAAFLLQAALRRGVQPERVGVVLYDVERYLLPLRRALERRGVPYRALQLPAAVDPRHRRWRAVLQLLRRGAAAPLDAWLDALAPRQPEPRRAGPAGAAAAAPGWPSAEAIEDLRVGLRLVGALGLRDVARLDPARLLQDEEDLPLPVRAGLRSSAPTDDGSALRWYAARKRLGGETLRWAVNAARALERALEGWATAALAEHLARTRALLGEQLGWSLDADAVGPIATTATEGGAVLDPLEAALPPALELDRACYLSALENHLTAQLAPAAASGGGIWVLDLARARSLTFDELLLLGVNRGSLPRASADDPLLGEALRQRLQRALPELPLKRAAQDEQRYLFAQLLTAAPRVTLCWQQVDDGGGEQAPSPLVQRLLAAPVGSAAPAMTLVPGAALRRLQPPHAGGPLRPRTADELAQVAALSGGAAGLAPVLGPRWLEAQAAAGPAPALGLDEAAAEAVARAQLALLAARDGAPHPRPGAPDRAEGGPYAGTIGGLRPGVSDPRRGALSVTALEDFARCPWRTLLRRVLRVEPCPDPQAQLPELSAATVGLAVHRALELLVGASGEPRAQTTGLRGPARTVRCPGPGARHAAVERAAAEIAHDAGFGLLPGLHRALALCVRPRLDRALALDWPAVSASVEVVGTECEGTALLPDAEGQERPVTFRADRVDRRDQALVLTDFKTGRPLSDAKRASTRLEHLRSAVRRGERLQAAIYAASGAGQAAIGRYVFLAAEDERDQDPEDDDPGAATAAAQAAPDFALAHDDEAVTHDLPRVARVLFAAWDAGLFFPRLELPKERPQRLCEHCEVRAACVQGDSGARDGQRRWLAALRRERARPASAGVAAPDAAGASLLALWDLAAEGGAGESSA